MKPLIQAALTLALLICASQVHALDASVQVYRFSGQEKPYVEVFFYIIGDTAIDSTGNRSVEILYYFTDQDGAATGDKYNLVLNASSSNPDFMDMKRHYLDPGTYKFVSRITDRYSDDSPVVTEQVVEVLAHGDEIAISDLQLQASAKGSYEMDKWYKNGRRCIPLAFNYGHEDLNEIILYSELYNTDVVLSDDFYIRYAVSTVAGDFTDPLIKFHKRLSPAPVLPVFAGLDLTTVCSGWYHVRAEVFDKEGNLLCYGDASFRRHNPQADALLVSNFDKYYANSFTHGMDEDSLRYVMKALAATVSQVEVQVVNDLLKRGEADPQRRFIHQYWVEESPSDPEGGYKKFIDVANTVDGLFHSGNGYGFETDRGRIFLRYGAPSDQIGVEDEPSAPPYTIWVYYEFPATNQTNVKFLFYDPSLSNEYMLLHSTALGELQNASWQQMLYRDDLVSTSGGDLIDSKPVGDGFYRFAVEYFNDY